jgi:hydroxymethylpyrimidine/phosphomethylpyrimidine kinase
MPNLPPCVLTVAGSDSGAGAGVQADARTIHALGGFACMAITAITAQNTRGVAKWEPVPPPVIAAQIEAVLGGWSVPSPARSSMKGLSSPPGTAGSTSGALPIRAIKTGLIPGAPAVRAIARALGTARAIPLVIDPVVGSTSGTAFLDRSGIAALKSELLPMATLVTPNWPEAEALSGVRIRSFTSAERAGRQLAAACGCAVLVKGGHAAGGLCRDCLVTFDGAVHWFECARIDTPNTHGTGCVLSAAIATNLAKGRTLESSIKAARDFLRSSLRKHRNSEWGGAGPAFPG